MLNLESLRKIPEGMRADVERAQQVTARLDAAIAAVKAERGRSAEWVREQIEAARKAATAECVPIVRDFDDRVAAVDAALPYWQSKALILSRVPFDPTDASRDSTIRLRWMQELAALPGDLLQLVADDAIAEQNVPLVYQCVVASQARLGEPGWSGISLDSVEPRGQQAALAAIADCHALRTVGHSIFATVTGARLTGGSRLAAARAAQGVVDRPNVAA